MRLNRGDALVVASHNKGKVREIEELLAPFGFAVKGAAELGLVEPEETEATFEGNAILKARTAAEVSGITALADDSGLSVTALDGAPGIYSARWAGESKDFTAAMARVERELRGAKDRSAKFVCVLALASPGGEVETFRGEVEGTLVFRPRGARGFGYDPIFVANGMTETFAEIDPAAKHAMSHRAKAFEKFVAALELKAKTK
ncbi:MAG TPA: RdgB/HAM1 family non-canonical purine NTP pyrophosphatase [Rhizomicrobium sp.]|jgi:XTP/dITP diphosphohydrolase|nr:RdgB/HAM1 family non-canonical purine NTP pyrophosphatase [Rhizomicrobium sp.]